MRVYFVRHGESEENTTNIYTGPSTKLTDAGYEQARFVAERFATIPVDLIIASTMVRAKETARIISEKIGQGVVHSDLLVECRAISELLNKKPDDPETMQIRSDWFNIRFSDENARYSDEENFADLRTRAREALAFIASQSVDDCLVVTHGTFLRIMLGYMLMGEDFSSDLFHRLRGVLSMSNTGITVCEYGAPPSAHDQPMVDTTVALPGGAPGWRLITWNDHAHLG